MNEHLIKMVEYLCNENSISVNKLLKECNVNKSVIDNLKKGFNPTINNIIPIADYFDVTLDYLVGREVKK